MGQKLTACCRSKVSPLDGESYSYTPVVNSVNRSSNATERSCATMEIHRVEDCSVNNNNGICSDHTIKTNDEYQQPHVDLELSSTGGDACSTRGVVISIGDDVHLPGGSVHSIDGDKEVFNTSDQINIKDQTEKVKRECGTDKEEFDSTEGEKR